MTKERGLDAWEAWVVAFSRTFAKVERQVADDEASLPLHWYDVLLVLYRAPDRKLRLRDIAERIVTSRAALSRCVAKLEQEQLIRKLDAVEDGRGQYAEITSKGVAAFKRTWPVYRRAIREHFSGKLTERDAEQLIRILAKL